MNTFHPVTQEKFRLKKIARKIRDIKNDLHLKGKMPDINGHSAATLQKQLGLMKYIFRHRHMAYCLVRGKTIAQVESGNPLKGRSWDLINVFRMELYEKINDYYRAMVEDLMEDSKKKDHDVIKLQMVKHVWDLYLNDDQDVLDSTAALIDTMQFILYGPEIVSLKPIGFNNKVSGLIMDISLDDGQAHNEGIILSNDIMGEDIPDRLIMDLLEAEDFMMPEAEDMDFDDLFDELDALDAMLDPNRPDDEPIELTDEVVFIGSDDGIIISVMKCACCGNGRSFCDCPEFCYPECAVCHQGNGNCTCDIPKSNCPYQDYYITEYVCKLADGPKSCCYYGKDWRTCSVYIKTIGVTDCPFEGKCPDRSDMDIPCSIRGFCDFFGKDFLDCGTYKTRDPESHNLKC